SESFIKSTVMGALGFLISFVGIGLSSGVPRFDYGFPILAGGFEMISVIIGFFAIAEVLKGLEERRIRIKQVPIKRVFATIKDLQVSRFTILRGSILGFFLGKLPALSAAITSYLT